MMQWEGLCSGGMVNGNLMLRYLTDKSLLFAPELHLPDERHNLLQVVQQ